MNEVFLILLGAAILFASNRVRPDVVALLTVLALMLTGVLTPREALAGFGDPVIIVIAGLLVVGEALTRTGVAQAISRWIMRFAGSNETRILILLMASAGLLGAVMSSTAVVAIFIPVALAIGRKSGVAPSRLLIPLSYASLISGMLTLIATTPNLVASSELDKAGFEPFNFFDFTPLGLTVLVLGIAYIVLFGRRFLPGQERTPVETVRQGMRELLADFDIPGQANRLRISPLSPLVGRTLVDSEIGTRYDAWIILLEREERLGRVTKASPSGDLTLRAGDVLVVGGAQESIDQLVNETELERLPLEDRHRRRWLRDVGLAIVLVHPESRMLGKSLKKGRFRSRYSLNVLAVRRKGKVLDSFLDKSLQVGDELLLLGSWDLIGRLQRFGHDFVLLALPAELQEMAPARRLAPVALLILIGMVLLTALKIVPIVVAVMLAALAVVATRTLTMEDAYRSIHLSSLVLVAGMLPVADALQKTGGVDLVVGGLVSGLGDSGPYLMLSALFWMTAGLGVFLSNTATAVLMAPIAIGAAQAVGVSPYAFVMTIAIAASAVFMSPFSTPVVTLVVAPGGYRFSDFLKVGTPLVILTWLVALLLIPLLFPF